MLVTTTAGLTFAEWLLYATFLSSMPNSINKSFSLPLVSLLWAATGTYSLLALESFFKNLVKLSWSFFVVSSSAFLQTKLRSQEGTLIYQVRCDDSTGIPPCSQEHHLLSVPSFSFCFQTPSSLKTVLPSLSSPPSSVLCLIHIYVHIVKMQYFLLFVT